MTGGRALVLGDPGPWMCSGMTGGVVYQRVQPEMGLTVDAINRRIAEGAVVEVMPLDDEAIDDINVLLRAYIHILESAHQAQAAERLYALLVAPRDHFAMIAPPHRRR